MLTSAPSHPSFSEPPALLAIARAAHLIGDRKLERAARELLRENYGIRISFRRTVVRERTVADESC